MDIATALLQEAERYATNAQRQLAKLETELQEIERQKRDIEAKCQAARHAPQRLLKFQVKVGTDYQCPRCWVEHERRSPLHGIGSRSDDDIMGCSTCKVEFVIPYR